jgi:hypothetical protein
MITTSIPTSTEFRRKTRKLVLLNSKSKWESVGGKLKINGLLAERYKSLSSLNIVISIHMKGDAEKKQKIATIPYRTARFIERVRLFMLK